MKGYRIIVAIIVCFIGHTRTTFGSPKTLNHEPNFGLRAFSACQIYACLGSKNDGRGVIPDYEVKQKPEDTAKGVDTVLQFTLDLIRKSSQEKQ